MGSPQETYQVPNAAGGDTALYELLTSAQPTTQDAVSFVPEDALAYSSATVNFQGWWDYLNELAASVPELGGDLNTLLLSFFGVDLRTNLFRLDGFAGNERDHWRERDGAAGNGRREPAR